MRGAVDFRKVTSILRQGSGNLRVQAFTTKDTKVHEGKPH